MTRDPLHALRLPSVPIEPRRAFADALWRRIAGGEELVAQAATVRYFVEDLDEAIAFYRDQLGFEEELHPSPTFAMLYRGELRLLLSVPGEPHAVPDGTLPEHGGWNRISLRVSDLHSTVAALRAKGVTLCKETQPVSRSTPPWWRTRRATSSSYSSRAPDTTNERLPRSEQMSTVSVRYIVDDVDAAIDFYCGQLGFEQQMHPDPAFAMLTRGDLRLVLASPVGSDHPGGGSRPMPDGTEQQPGGWNRIMLQVSDLEGTIEELRPHGVQSRNEVVTGIGTKQILVQDPAGNLVELFEPIRSEARLSS